MIFDEAQNAVLKELLPFWAGFTRQDDVQFTEKHGDQLPRKCMNFCYITGGLVIFGKHTIGLP